jgi:hypothetical protein
VIAQGRAWALMPSLAGRALTAMRVLSLHDLPHRHIIKTDIPMPPGRGKGVIAYTGFLVANGYAETTGDAAHRERYGRVALPRRQPTPKPWSTVPDRQPSRGRPT